MTGQHIVTIRVSKDIKQRLEQLTIALTNSRRLSYTIEDTLRELLAVFEHADESWQTIVEDKRRGESVIYLNDLFCIFHKDTDPQHGPPVAAFDRYEFLAVFLKSLEDGKNLFREQDRDMKILTVREWIEQRLINPVTGIDGKSQNKN